MAKGSDIYLVGDFLLQSHASRPELFESARQFALAQVFASTLTVGDLGTYTGSIAGLHVYLDTRVILQTLGVYGPERMAWVREFLAYLKDHGAAMRVFDHTYSETETILENCKPYVESGRYNASLASHACRHFHEIGASESDVEEFVLSMRPILEALDIEYFEGSYDAADNEFQLEEQSLREAIEKTYREGDSNRFRELNEDTIRKDVRSIALVHRMRQGAKPHKLSEAQHVFVTTNSSLARASRDVEIEAGGGVVVPDAVRDVFLATIAWLQAPNTFEVVDASRFLADCYAAIGVDDTLVMRFLGKVEQLRNRGGINDEDYYQLRMHRYALRVLGDVTLGDLDNLTDDTPLEVLARIEDRIRRDAEETLRAEREEHSGIVAEYQSEVQASIAREHEAEEKIRQLNDDIATTKARQARLVDTIAGIAATALAWPLFVVVVTCGLAAYFGDFFQGRPLLQAIQRVVAFLFLILSLLSLANGFNIAGLRRRLKSRIAETLSKRIADS